MGHVFRISKSIWLPLECLANGECVSTGFRVRTGVDSRMACANEKRSATGTTASAFPVKSTLRLQQVRGQKLTPCPRYTIPPEARRGEVNARCPARRAANFREFLLGIQREFG